MVSLSLSTYARRYQQKKRRQPRSPAPQKKRSPELEKEKRPRGPQMEVVDRSGRGFPEGPALRPSGRALTPKGGEFTRDVNLYADYPGRLTSIGSTSGNFSPINGLKCSARYLSTPSRCLVGTSAQVTKSPSFL